MKRILCAALLVGACGGDNGGVGTSDATPAEHFDAQPGGSPDARPGPGTPDARPAPDSPPGTPDARPMPDAAPGTPDAAPSTPDAAPFCSGAECILCTAIDDPVVGTVDWPSDGSLFVFDIATQGSRVFLATGGPGIQIWDIDPAGQLTRRSVYDTPGAAWGLAVRGDLLYVADGDNGLLVLDVSDPTAPTPVGGVVFAAAQHVALDGNFAYVASWGVPLRVFELADPQTPVAVGGWFNTTQKALDVAVTGGRAYVTDYDGFVLIFDVSNPYEVALFDTLDTGGTGIGNIAAAGTTFYLANLTSGVEIFDARDPTAPTLSGTFDPPDWGDAEDLVLDGNRLYIAYGTRGLDIIDVRDPADPAMLGTYRVPNAAFTIGLAGGFVIIGDNVHGLQVLDPDRVAEVSHVSAEISLGSDAIRRRMATDGTFVYIAAASAGLEVVDLSSGVPRVVGSTPVAGGHALDLVYRDGLVYVAGAQAGLVIFDVADPLHPRVAGALDLPDVTGFVAVDGDWAYLYGYDHRTIYSVFVANPTHPGLGGSLVDSNLVVNGLAARGDWVYAANNNLGLTAIDVSDPYHPQTAGTATLNHANDGAMDVALSGDLALVPEEESGLAVVDLSDPGHPVQVGHFDTPGNAVSVTVAAGLAYVGEGMAPYAPADVQIVDFSDPAAPRLALALDAPEEISDIIVLGRHILLLVDRSTGSDDLILRRVCDH